MTREEAKQWIESLIKTMRTETSGPCPDTPYKDEVYVALEMAIEALKQQEKIGKWEITTTTFCGRTFEVIECSCCKQKQDWYAKTDYCPNCGAKMEVSE